MKNLWLRLELISLILGIFLSGGCSLNPFAADPVQTEAKASGTTGWRLRTDDGREFAGAAGTTQTVSLGVSRDDKCGTLSIARPGSGHLQVGDARGSTTEVERPVTVCGKGLIR